MGFRLPLMRDTYEDATIDYRERNCSGMIAYPLYFAFLNSRFAMDLNETRLHFYSKSM